MTRAASDRGASPIVSLAVSIRRDEVIRLLGYPDGYVLPPRLDALVDQALATARGAVRARGAFVGLEPARAPEVGLRRRAATTLVVGLVTAGDEIDERIADASRQGEPTRALLLDAAGSAAVEEAADRLGAIIVADADAGAVAPAADGTVAALPCRFSPGYGGWSLADQERLLAVLPRAALGVTLLPSMMMVPRKTVSFGMWLGAKGARAAGRGCARCPLAGCHYRRGPRRPGAAAAPTRRGTP